MEDAAASDPPESARSGGPAPAAARCEVVVDNAGRHAGVGVRRLRPWLERLAGELAPVPASLGVRLAGDRDLRAANLRWRRRDRVTDVLSFPGQATPEGRHLGDILISVPAARRQAVRHGHDLERELRILLLHGVLHCLGHDHETDGGEMDRLERSLRRRWIGEDAEDDDGDGDDA